MNGNFAPKGSSESGEINKEEEALKRELLQDNGFVFQGSASRYAVHEELLPAEDPNRAVDHQTTRAQNLDRQFGPDGWTTVRSEVPTNEAGVPVTGNVAVDTWQAGRLEIYGRDPLVLENNPQLLSIGDINHQLATEFPPQQ